MRELLFLFSFQTKWGQHAPRHHAIFDKDSVWSIGTSIKFIGETVGGSIVTKARERFKDRVENYVKYRPGYPKAIFDFMATHLGLRPSSVIVDLGSGTGLSCAPFLERGNEVYGVEPNDNMRAAAERLLAGYPRFYSKKGSAESTGLPNRCQALTVYSVRSI